MVQQQGPSNPMYFKTVLVNVWQAVLPIFALWIYFYNVRKYKMVASGSNTFAVVTFPLLFIAFLVDCVVDLIAEGNADNLGSGGGMIVVMIIMIVVSIFNVLYIVSYKKIYTECPSLCAYEGYHPLDEDKEKNLIKLYALNAKETETLLEEDDEGKLAERVQEHAAIMAVLQSTDWFAVINVTVMMNVIWAAAATSMLITLGYIMRVVAIYDDNHNREADVAGSSAGSIGLMVLIGAYDFWHFRTYTYPIFAHYIAFFVYATSSLVEYHGIVGLEEAVTLGYMAAAGAAFAVKVKAGVDFKENKFHQKHKLQ